MSAIETMKKQSREIARLTAEIERNITKAALDNANSEIERLQADKAAISQTASDYLHEIDALQARLAAIKPPPLETAQSASVAWAEPSE